MQRGKPFNAEGSGVAAQRTRRRSMKRMAAEIAEVVGSTEGAARVHYHNAIRTVKEFLRDE